MVTGLRRWRKQNNLTQVDAAAVLGVSQSYLSLLENGTRPLTSELGARLTLVRKQSVPISPDDKFRAELSALGYPGFAHIRPSRSVAAPGVVLVEALFQPTLDARVTEALPWLVWKYARELDWNWLVVQAKLHNLQNRMGFLTHLALSIDQVRPQPSMQSAIDQLDDARLLAESTFCWDSMPLSTRKWMLRNRSPEAAHWNVVTRIRAGELNYADEARHRRSG